MNNQDIEAALKNVFSVHRNVVRGLSIGLRVQLHRAVKEKEKIQKSSEQKCLELQEEIEKLTEENGRLVAALHTQMLCRKTSQTPNHGTENGLVSRCSIVLDAGEGQNTNSSLSVSDTTGLKLRSEASRQEITVAGSSDEDNASVRAVQQTELRIAHVQPDQACPGQSSAASGAQYQHSGSTHQDRKTAGPDPRCLNASTESACPHLPQSTATDTQPGTGATEEKKISPKLQLSRDSLKKKRYRESTSEERQQKRPCCPSVDQAPSGSQSKQTATSAAISSQLAVQDTHTHMNDEVIPEKKEALEQKRKHETVDSFKMPSKAPAVREAPASRSPKSVESAADWHVPETCQPTSPAFKRGWSASQPNDDNNQVQVIPETLAADVSFSSIADEEDGVIVSHSKDSESGGSSELDCSDSTCRSGKPQHLTPYPTSEKSLSVAVDSVEGAGETDQQSVLDRQSEPDQQSAPSQPPRSEKAHRHQSRLKSGTGVGELSQNKLTSNKVGNTSRRAAEQTTAQFIPCARSDSIVFDSTLPLASSRAKSVMADIPNSVVCTEQTGDRSQSPVFTDHKDTTSDEGVSPALFEDFWGTRSGPWKDCGELVVEGDGAGGRQSFPPELHSGGKLCPPSTPPTSRSKHQAAVTPDSPPSPLLLRPVWTGSSRQVPEGQECDRGLGLVVPSAAGQERTSESRQQQAERRHRPGDHGDNSSQKRVCVTPVRPVQRKKLFHRRTRQLSPMMKGTSISADETVDPRLLDENGAASGEDESTSLRACNSPSEKPPDITALKSPMANRRRQLSPQLNASLDPGVRLTQFIGDSGEEDSSTVAEDSLDVTLDPRFQRVHEISALDTTVISQSCSGNTVASGQGPSMDGKVNQVAGDQTDVVDLDDSFDRAPARKDEKNFAYKEVVRKQADRRKLKGFSCQQCLEYYRSAGLTDEEAQARMKECSRHRGHYAPPSTPEHFWSIGFPDTQECDERGYHN